MIRYVCFSTTYLLGSLKYITKLIYTYLIVFSPTLPVKGNNAIMIKRGGLCYHYVSQ